MLSELKTIFEICVSAALGGALLIGLLVPIGQLIDPFVHSDRLSKIERAILWFAAGTCISITTVVWMYLLGGDWSQIRVGIFGLTFVGLGSALIRAIKYVLSRLRAGKWGTISFSQIGVLLVMATTCLAVFMLPRTFDGRVTSRQLMGPDALGYSNAAAAILEEGSFQELQTKAIQSSGYNLLYELFSWDILGVYQIPDKSLSIQTEFVVGAYRIGFPSLVAILTDVLGYRNLLTSMYVTAWIFVVATGVLLWALLKSFGYSTLISLVSALVCVTNLNLVVGFHEGGVVQAFILFASISFAVAFLLEGLSSAQRCVLFVTAFLMSISSYLDIFVVLVVSLVGIWLVAMIRHDSTTIQRSRQGLMGLVVACLLMLPIMVRFPRFLLRRVADARQAGWVWDSWSELTGVIGISNTYMSPPDSIINQLILIGLGLIAYKAWTQRGQARDTAFSFSLTILAVSGGFYLYTRYLMVHTNYQWFKFVGTYLGPLSLLLLLSCLPRNSVNLRMWSWTNKCLLVATVCLALNSTADYARNYWGESVYVDSDVIDELSRPEVRAITSRFVVFGQYGWQEIGLTPFWPAAFLNRYDLGVRPNIPPDSPVGLVINRNACPQWVCLEKVPDENKLSLGNEYLILDLNLTGRDVMGETPYMQWRRVNQSLRLLGAPFVNKNWTDLSETLTYVN